MGGDPDRRGTGDNMNTQLRGCGLIGSLALSLCACGPADDSYHFEADIGFRSGDDGTVDAQPGRPSGGGWISNGLQDPSLGGVDPAYGLSTPQGLSPAVGLLDEPALRGTAEYLVECALPWGSSITKEVDGQTLVFDGLLGLAPEWEDGDCDQDCQEWVSACLLARTNGSGNEVVIWIQGEHEGVGYGVPEGAVLEAAFYGNLFVDSDERYLCKGSRHDVVEAHRNGRTCSFGWGDDCDFTMYRSCSKKNRCDFTGPNQDVPSNCRSGKKATSAPMHTIATYIVPMSP